MDNDLACVGTCTDRRIRASEATYSLDGATEIDLIVNKYEALPLVYNDGWDTEVRLKGITNDLMISFLRMRLIIRQVRVGCFVS